MLSPSPHIIEAVRVDELLDRAVLSWLIGQRLVLAVAVFE